MIKLNKDGLNVPSVTTESITMGDTEVSSFNQFVSKNENGEIEETLYLKGHIKPTTDRAQQFIDIGYDYDSRTGALIALRGVDYESKPGAFALIARNATEHSSLDGLPNGTLTWGSSTVVTYSVLNDLNNNISFSSNTTEAWIGYQDSRNGSRLFFFTTNNNSNPGQFRLVTGPDSNGNRKTLIGYPNGDLTWRASNVVTYSLLNNLDSNIYFTTDNSRTGATIGFNGSTNGARCTFYNKNHTSYPGYFQLVAGNSSSSANFTGKPDGTLTWAGKEVITNFSRSHIYFDPAISTARDIGYSVSNNSKRGAYLTFKAGGDSSNPGMFSLVARDESSAAALKGFPNGDLSWNDGYIMPVGTIVAYTSSTIPAGWLYCGGGAVSRTTYAKLFSVIGTKYGAGDGSTTFNLPGGQGNFLQGYLSNVPIGSKVSPGLPNITGSASFSYGATGERPGGFRSGSGALGVSMRAQMSFLRDSGTTLEVYENVTLNASNSNSIYGKSASVQPPAIMVAYIIKYK